MPKTAKKATPVPAQPTIPQDFFDRLSETIARAVSAAAPKEVPPVAPKRENVVPMPKRQMQSYATPDRPRLNGTRVVYRATKGKHAKDRLNALIPMEWTVYQFVIAHPGATCAAIADATNMKTKTVESALYRLRRVHDLVESVPQPVTR